jgi:hypothetical protein
MFLRGQAALLTVGGGIFVLRLSATTTLRRTSSTVRLLLKQFCRPTGLRLRLPGWSTHWKYVPPFISLRTTSDCTN